jgi:hypothetical protein
MAQARPTPVRCRSACTDGSATFTVVRFATIMNWTDASTARAHHLRAWAAAEPASGSVSAVVMTPTSTR